MAPRSSPSSDASVRSSWGSGIVSNGMVTLSSCNTGSVQIAPSGVVEYSGPSDVSSFRGPLSRRYRPTPGRASMLNPETRFDARAWRKKPIDSSHRLATGLRVPGMFYSRHPWSFAAFLLGKLGSYHCFVAPSSVGGPLQATSYHQARHGKDFTQKTSTLQEDFANIADDLNSSFIIATGERTDVRTDSKLRQSTEYHSHSGSPRQSGKLHKASPQIQFATGTNLPGQYSRRQRTQLAEDRLSGADTSKMSKLSLKRHHAKEAILQNGAIAMAARDRHETIGSHRRRHTQFGRRWVAGRQSTELGPPRPKMSEHDDRFPRFSGASSRCQAAMSMATVETASDSQALLKDVPIEPPRSTNFKVLRGHALKFRDQFAQVQRQQAQVQRLFSPSSEAARPRSKASSPAGTQNLQAITLKFQAMSPIPCAISLGQITSKCSKYLVHVTRLLKFSLQRLHRGHTSPTFSVLRRHRG
ncbi:uncharacterized protein BDZ99DRAFT_477606 [Mytilinidion resinicola]|uniref:Uncharacterized protein n=1 Tax=Mytilinidion resinicola TaxID=574789 RepID=A0A6A6YMD6_9PEZI|nr:uncharacterized protein BDZ99DRAFT_477606 [Mytilinidion resinicola]KAF2809154.1 hypothetical protein BDZ99DRAFT_477606 [Mytilinidion resinicola]